MRDRGNLGWRAGELFVAASVVAVQAMLWTGPEAGWAVSVGALAWTLPLVFLRRFPLAVPIVYFAGLAVQTGVVPDAFRNGTAILGGAIASAWTLGARNELRRGLAGAAVVLVLAQVVNHNFATFTVEESLFTLLLVGGPFFAGAATREHGARARRLRERAARLELERERRIESAVVDERARVARELHDVVAHSVSVMTIQAGAARLQLDLDPANAESSLVAVEETGRETLAEMRRMFGALADGAVQRTIAPRPGMGQLGTLVEQVRATGLPVEVELGGPLDDLPSGLDLAAFRIVQEALTNVRKHAGPAQARVAVRRDGAVLELEITDDGRGATARPAEGAGHGIVGMRERAAVYGGELEARALAAGGFRVRARLPLQGAAG